jgi:NitT/TauT family transport system substrate-binding protein
MKRLMKRLNRRTQQKVFYLAFCVVAILSLAASLVGCAAPPTFAWSVYVGWMPWSYAMESGILKKWTQKEKVRDIQTQQFQYVPSIMSFITGKSFAVVMTNMEMINMAASAGIDCTVLAAGDYSFGNDGVKARDGIKMSDLKGKQVYAVDGSVNVFVLFRGLQIETGGKVKYSDVEIVNTNDDVIAPAFINDPKQKVGVFWNPQLLQVTEQASDAKTIFDSSKIPEEVQDLLVIRTDVLKKDPGLGRALVGAWYETIALMHGPTKSDKALSSMANAAGCSLEAFNKQLSTTYMYWTPAEASDFVKSKRMIEVTDLVRKFCGENGLFGNGHEDVNSVGITFPDGTILGNPDNIKIRFTTEYVDALR